MYDDKEIELYDNAITVILEVRRALTDGIKHYRKSDMMLLKTDIEIIEALIDEKEIILEIKE